MTFEQKNTGDRSLMILMILCMGHPFSPTSTRVREGSQIIGAGENERGTEMLI